MTAVILYAVMVVTMVKVSTAERCTGESKLGAVLDVLTSQPEANQKIKGMLDVTLRIRTPLNATGKWLLTHSIGTRRKDAPDIVTVTTFNVWSVPEKDDTSIRAKSTTEGSDVYSFHLHFDSYDKEVKISFELKLAHPCNEIYLTGKLDVWMTLTGKDLPSTTNVPPPIVDLTQTTSFRMRIGLAVNPDVMEIDYANTYLKNKRIANELFTVDAGSVMEAIDISWEDTDLGKKSKGSERLDGSLVVSKRGQHPDFQALTIMPHAYLQPNTTGWRKRLGIKVMTQVLLQEFEQTPAVALSSSQFYKKQIRSPRNEVLYDASGRVLPLVDDPKSLLPLVFACSAQGGKRTPSVTAMVKSKDGSSLDRPLEALSTDASPSVKYAYSVYEVPELSMGDEVEIVCSATDGDSEATLPFTVMSLQPASLTTPNQTMYALNADTFRNGLRFTCRAEGVPLSSVKFYKEGRGHMDTEPYLKAYVDGSGWYQERGLGKDGRFSLETSEGQVSLVISPGSSPFPQDRQAFRILCIGTNLNTFDAAYVRFVAPNVPPTN